MREPTTEPMTEPGATSRWAPTGWSAPGCSGPARRSSGWSWCRRRTAAPAGRSPRRSGCVDVTWVLLIRMGVAGAATPIRRGMALSVERCRASDAYRLNWNQLRLPRSPAALVVNVRYTVCTPVADPVRLVVRLTHVCQPPVLLTGTLASTGPVVLSILYWMVPVTVAAEANRVVTEAGLALPKSTAL